MKDKDFDKDIKEELGGDKSDAPADGSASENSAASSSKGCESDAEGSSYGAAPEEEVYESLLAKRLGLTKKSSGEEPTAEPAPTMEYGDIKVKSPVSTKLANFWYHYKWHTIAALFVAAVITFVLVNCLNRKSYDAHIIFVGRDINRSSGEYNDIVDGFKQVVGDYSKDGEIYVNFNTKTAYSPEELEEVNSTEGFEVSESFLLSEWEDLEYEMFQGTTFYVCLLSEYAYNSLNNLPPAEGGALFAPLTSFLPEGGKYSFYGNSDNAILLSSLPIYELDGIKKLPPDTLVCLRIKTLITDDKDYKEAKNVLWDILSYGQ